MADGTITDVHDPREAAFRRTTFFASGSNQPGEIHALSLIDGANIGVVAGRVHQRSYRAAWRELDRFVATGRKLFIDSGAFGEVEFPGGVPTITKPLTDADWRAIFDVYTEAARTHGANAYVVAPDCVAHQAESLSRLFYYQDRVRDVCYLGATILVPIQKGEISMAAFYRAAVNILGCPFTPSIPMKKDATKLSELRAFVDEIRPSSIHLLGLAPDTDDGRAAIETVLAIVPDCRVSCDACLIMRWVGKKNGRGGGPRRLTSMNDYWGRRLALDPEGVDEHETHLRKMLAMYHAASTFWTDLTLAEASLPERVALPADVAADVAAEPWLLHFVSAIYAQDGGEGGAGARPQPFDCLTLATLATNLADDDEFDDKLVVT